MCMCICMNVNMYICEYVYMNVCVYVCRYICMYVYNICSSLWPSRPPPPPRVAFLRSPMEAGKPMEKFRKLIKNKESHRPTKMYHMCQAPAPSPSNLRSFIVALLWLYDLFHTFTHCFLHGFQFVHMIVSLFPYNCLMVSTWFCCGCLIVFCWFSYRSLMVSSLMVSLWLPCGFLIVPFRERPTAPTPTEAHPTGVYIYIYIYIHEAYPC